jgi:hypothetical protein
MFLAETRRLGIEIKTGVKIDSLDLLADYDSEHYDYGTVEYDDLWAETQEGLWIPEDEWLENNL